MLASHETFHDTINKPAASSSCQHLLSGVDDAIATISSILENSQQIRTDYTTHWSSILDSYEKDVAEFDDMLEQLSLLHRRIGKEDGIINSNHHALNFHIQLDTSKGNDTGVFMLPPSDELDSQFNLDDSMSLVSHVPKAGDNHSKNRQISLEQRRKTEQTLKFSARETMIGKFNEMRENEMQIERRLKEDEKGDDSIMTDDERAELQASLNKCQQQHSRNIIAFVSSYKPKASGKTSSHGSQLKRKGQGVPSIERMLEDIEKTKGASDDILPQTLNKASKKRSIVKMSTTQGEKNNKELCEMIMNDREQFMSIENLPFRPFSAVPSQAASPKKLTTGSDGEGRDIPNEDYESEVDSDDCYESDDGFEEDE